VAQITKIIFTCGTNYLSKYIFFLGLFLAKITYAPIKQLFSTFMPRDRLGVLLEMSDFCNYAGKKY